MVTRRASAKTRRTEGVLQSRKINTIPKGREGGVGGTNGLKEAYCGDPARDK